MDEKFNFPQASARLLSDLYVDDFITSANSVDEILQIRNDTITLLRRGGFNIRHWASNHESALADIKYHSFSFDHIIKTDSVLRILGIIWDSKRDTLAYRINPPENKLVTKRVIVSELAKILDPLGLLGPIMFIVKLIIQQCWKDCIRWDESLPQDLYLSWLSFIEQLPLLDDFSIPRRILIDTSVSVEIHGFCDASLKSYGACLYVRSVDKYSPVSVYLACAKPRVSPLKKVTISRLELCAAVLLVELYHKVAESFNCVNQGLFFWSVSTIVLSWLKKDPAALKVFESNRVRKIKSLGSLAHWRNVRSEQNPADCLSRGMLPREFIRNDIWLYGPSWLRVNSSNWPSGELVVSESIPGLKDEICLALLGELSTFYLKFSSYPRLIRAIARALSWLPGCKRRLPLTVDNLKEAEKNLMILLQREQFSIELKRLVKNRDTCTKKTTKFDSLAPFADLDGLIRVRGRFDKSSLSYEAKHPILLPSMHHITNLVIRDYHTKGLHAGLQSTLSLIRDRFWIPNGRDRVRRVINNCVPCIKVKPKRIQIKIADLPSARVTKSHTFEGVEIAL